MKTSFSRHMKPPHIKASKAVGYALTIADYSGWFAVSALFAVHLKPSEIAALSIAALSVLDDDSLAAVFDYMDGSQ